MDRRVEIELKDGERLAAHFVRASSARAPAVLLVDPSQEHARELAATLVNAGFTVLALACGDAAWLRADRHALPKLEAALAWLARAPGVDDRRLAAVGFAAGGNLAYLLGCTSRRVACAVDVHGPLVHAELDVSRPMQPLEFALNLSVPLLAAFGTRDARITAAQRAQWRELLDSGAKHVELLEFDAADAGFWDARERHFRAEDARELERRVVAFLVEQLEPEGDD